MCASCFDQIFADHRGVQRGAATGENDPADIAQLRRRHVQSAELGGALFQAEPAAHRVAHGAGLLKDFLEHVVRVIAFLDVLGGELDFADLVIARFAGERADLEFVALDRDEIEVVQVNGVARVGDDRADIAGEKIFVLADAEDERAAAPGADDEIGNVAVDERDAVGADDLLQRRANGVDEQSFLVERRSVPSPLDRGLRPGQRSLRKVCRSECASTSVSVSEENCDRHPESVDL